MRLRQLVKELSSKNAGNFSTSFDIVFDDSERYRRVWSSGVITREHIAELFSVPEDDVLSIIPFEPGNAIKINMRRQKPSGDPGETDVFGAQQYAPLLDVEIP